MKSRSRSIPGLMALLLVVALAGCGKSPEEHFQAGRALLEKNDYKAAILELKSTLQEQPGNREARLMLGKAYLASEAYLDAEKELKKAQEQGASHEEVLPALAKALLRQNQSQKVLELELPATVLSEKARATVHLFRAEALFNLNRRDEGLQAIALTEQVDPKLPELLLFKARLALEGRNLAEALRLVDAALAGDPKLIQAYYIKAGIYEVDGKLDQALQAFERAVAIDPKAYQAYLSISDIQQKRGQNSEAEKALLAAEAVAPNMPLVKYMRGIYELRANNLKAANDILMEVLRVAPDYLPAQLASAIANLGLGNYEQSLKFAQTVLIKQPENLLAARVVAASQLKSGDAEEALATLAPLLKTQPDDAPLLALAGKAYFQNKDYQHAINSFKQAEAKVPGNSEMLFRQAASLLALGQTDQALAELEHATKLSEKVSRSDMALVSVHFQRRNYDKALQAITALEKKLPNNALTYNLRAVALLGKKDNAGARKSLEQALKLDPIFFPAVANLARLDLVEKQPNAAKKRFEALLVKDGNNLQAMLALAELSSLAKQEKDYLFWLEKAAKAHPDEVQPIALLARYYLAKKEFGKAVDSSRELVKANPSNLEALNLLGKTQFASNDPRAAIETFNQLVQKAPKSSEALLQLAVAQLAEKKYSEGRSSLIKALQLKADSVPAMDVFIRLEMIEKNPDAALQWAKKIQTTEPKSVIGFEREASIYMNQQRFAQAAKSYQKIFEKVPSTESVLKLHDALNRSGEAKTAQGKIDAWLKTHSNDLIVRNYLAALAIKAGQDKVAIAQYQEILRQQPSEVFALNNLANLYQRISDPRALELAEKANKSVPDNPSFQDTLGWILVEQEQLPRGMELLRAAASKAQKNPTIRYHYAVALSRAGKREEAQKELDAALAIGQPFAEAEAAKALRKSL